MSIIKVRINYILYLKINFYIVLASKMKQQGESDEGNYAAIASSSVALIASMSTIVVLGGKTLVTTIHGRNTR